MMNHQDTKAPSAYEPISADLDKIGREIVDCAYHVHKELGPGLLENIYEEAFACELQDRNLAFERQKTIPVHYKHHDLQLLYRIDLLIENRIIVEMKCSADNIIPLHDAQLLTYMKLMNVRLGYLINFNVPVIKNGIRRKAL